jgi:hypothetical protein
MIIFSKLLKIAKTAQNKFRSVASNVARNQGGAYLPHPRTPQGKRPSHMTQPGHYYEGFSDAFVESDAPTHTHAKNITHTQQ